jgi:hypothetical protein
MDKRELTFENIREELFATFPVFWERARTVFGSYYDLDKGTDEETPGSYPIFEDVVQKVMFELLEIDQDQRFLAQLFVFFEDMANSPNIGISNDLLGIAIIVPLVHKPESLRRAWKYTGPKMKIAVVAERERRGK